MRLLSFPHQVWFLRPAFSQDLKTFIKHQHVEHPASYTTCPEKKIWATFWTKYVDSRKSPGHLSICFYRRRWQGQKHCPRNLRKISRRKKSIIWTKPVGIRSYNQQRHSPVVSLPDCPLPTRNHVLFNHKEVHPFTHLGFRAVRSTTQLHEEHKPSAAC